MNLNSESSFVTFKLDQWFQRPFLHFLLGKMGTDCCVCNTWKALHHTPESEAGANPYSKSFTSTFIHQSRCGRLLSCTCIRLSTYCVKNWCKIWNYCQLLAAPSTGEAGNLFDVRLSHIDALRIHEHRQASGAIRNVEHEKNQGKHFGHRISGHRSKCR